ncbi:MAG: helix-turn-helix domain-containing protein [Dehalococcoidia bacterium]|jgi:hypothetical protein|nr:helix-turn-helix domain-containing protein [Dehalococcoidia bacterium]
MKLQSFLKKRNLNISQFVEKANSILENEKLNQPTVWRILKSKTIPRPETAALIEQATGGEVTRMELLYPETKVDGRQE